LPASVLAAINEDIGPDPNHFWVGLVFTLMLSVGFTIVGRITDIFGRRWALIGGTTLCLFGTIIASQATSINMLIGATVLIGLGAVAPSSVAYVVAELVPMKDRYLVLGLMFLWMIPVVALGPAVAWAFVLHTSASWRWCYYLMTITNGISVVLWFIFYHVSEELFRCRMWNFQSWPCC
jgi:MFS family permease